MSTMSTPSHCRPEAYHYLAEQLPRLETAPGLLHAAIALSMHALDDVVPQQVEERLEAMASRVRERVRSDRTQALLAHLHRVLFEEERFRGNPEHYYNPLNSYLSAVLETRRGIPISLSLVYKCVAERIGLNVSGINAPGHFLVQVRGGENMIVDPYFAGQILTPREAVARLCQATGSDALDESCLAEASHRAWISRMIANLQAIFRSQGRQSDLAAMDELQALVSRGDAIE